MDDVNIFFLQVIQVQVIEASSCSSNKPERWFITQQILVNECLAADDQPLVSRVFFTELIACNRRVVIDLPAKPPRAAAGITPPTPAGARTAP